VKNPIIKIETMTNIDKNIFKNFIIFKLLGNFKYNVFREKVKRNASEKRDRKREKVKTKREKVKRKREKVKRKSEKREKKRVIENIDTETQRERDSDSNHTSSH
jgi:dsDNA-specific endonuclease/ATPase MutS2